MAVYNVPNYLPKDGFGMSLNIRRGNPNPLDNSSVWSSYDAAWTYAKSDPTAYVGQVLSVVNTAEDGTLSVDVYKINNAAGDLELVGISPVGDEKSITIAEDGTVSLYGVSGLKLTREVEGEDGELVPEQITYQPLLVGGKLTWVEPSATTVEGLAAEIEGIKTRLTAVESAVGKAAEGENEATGLVKAVADVTAKAGELEETLGTKADASVLEEVKATADAAAVKKDVDSAFETTNAAVEDAQAAADDAKATIGGTYSKDATVASDIASVKESVTKEAEDRAAADDALDGRVTTLEGKIVDLSGAMHFKGVKDNIPEDKTGYVDGDVIIVGNKEYVFETDDFVEFGDIDDVTSRVTTLEGKVETLETESATKAELQAAQETLQSNIDNKADTSVLEEVKATADAAAVKKDVDSAFEEVNNTLSTKADASALDNYVTNDAHNSAVEEINEALGKKALASDLETLSNTLSEHTTASDSAFAALQQANTDMGARVKALEDVGSEKNVIAAVSSEFAVTDDTRTLSIVSVASDKVTGLADALAKKVDAIEGYTLLSPDDQAKLNALVLGDAGKVEISGKVNASNVEELDTWVINNRDTVAGLFSTTNATKLDGIAAGAQVNVIEEIQAAGTALSITDKKVNIGFATSALAGLIKSAIDNEGKTVANAVYVDSSTGVGKVNAVNVNTLVQDDDDTLILSGGNAAGISTAV